MYWQDQEEKKKEYVVPDDIVDVSFKVLCKQLPLDHAYALSQAIQNELPWIVDEPLAGVHLIHGAESGNGWIRPQEPDAILNLSARTRFRLRLPKHRVAEACQLVGKELNVNNYKLILSKPQCKLLSTLTTIFARHIITENIEDEEAFLNHMAELLNNEGISVTKMMSGLVHVLRMPKQNLFTRSLMIDGLKVEESIYLQQHGLGEGRKIGCGLFLPHKGIDAVGEAQQK